MSDLPDYLTDQLIKVLLRRDYLDRRATLKNDENPEAPASPAASLTGTAYKGKFFPRGCRGIIESLSIYCKRTGTGTLTLSLSPFPSLGPLASVTVTPGSDWGWSSVNYRKMWSYDSLFIWVSSIGSDVSYGYDEAGDPDGYGSDSEQTEWTAENRRYSIRVEGKGFTPGDIPVSGTLNMIKIPSTTTSHKAAVLTVDSKAEKYDTPQLCAGTLLIAIFRAIDVNARDYLWPRIKCDGVNVLPIDASFSGWHDQILTQYTPGITIGVYDTTNDYYNLIVTLPFEFTRKLEVGFYNDGAAAYEGGVFYTLKKIS